MTAKEALKLMQKNEPARVFGTEEYCEAYNLAEIALEKQIMLAPNCDKYLFYALCPVCHHRVNYPLSAGFNRPTFCMHCGVALDWDNYVEIRDNIVEEEK